MNTITPIKEVPNIVIHGIKIDLRHVNGARIEVGEGGHLGQLGNERGGGIVTSINVNKQEIPGEFIATQVVDVIVGGDRRIYGVPSKDHDGVDVYTQKIHIVRNGHWFSTDSGENSTMVLLFTKTGQVRVHVVTVVVQRNEFFLFKQQTRFVQAYRDEHVVKVPELLGDRAPWKLLSDRAASIFAGIAGKLPDISEYKFVPFDPSVLREGDVYVDWSSVRRQVSGGIRHDGKKVQLPWHKIKKDNPREFACLFDGEVVRVGEFLPAHGGSSLDFSAKDIQRLA